LCTLILFLHNDQQSKRRTVLLFTCWGRGAIIALGLWMYVRDFWCYVFLRMWMFCDSWRTDTGSFVINSESENDRELLIRDTWWKISFQHLEDKRLLHADGNVGLWYETKWNIRSALCLT
jgi:hypothetical protein